MSLPGEIPPELLAARQEAAALRRHYESRDQWPPLIWIATEKIRTAEGLRLRYVVKLSPFMAKARLFAEDSLRCVA
jgi:hypothetical protein